MKRAKRFSIVPTERIESRILLVRGQRVMIDSDVAELYGVSTKALNQAVRRNRDRFPADFMLRLTSQEKLEVVTFCDHLARLKFSANLPHAFTEHGALMLANVLRSERAIQASIAIVRAFAKLRLLLASHAALARKLAVLEKKYDRRFIAVFDAIRKLMRQPEAQHHSIGFEVRSRTRKH